MQFTTPLPFREAIRRLGDRTPIGSRLKSEEWSQVPIALRERAFFSSRIESVNFLQRTKGLLGDFLTGARETIQMPDGSQTTAIKVGSRAAFVDHARAFALAEGLGPIGEPGGLTDITSEKRLGLIYDIQTRSAWGYGDWKQGQDADVLDEFPAARFVRVQAVKEPRDTHWMHEGEVRLKSDLGFWTALNADFGVPWAPFGWGCGHDVEDVDRAEAEQLGLLAPGAAVVSAQQDFNRRLRASVSHLSPEMRAWLRESFGDMVRIDAGVVEWRTNARREFGHAPTGETPAPSERSTDDLTAREQEARLSLMEARIREDTEIIRRTRQAASELRERLQTADPAQAREIQTRLIELQERWLAVDRKLRDDIRRFVSWESPSESRFDVVEAWDTARVNAGLHLWKSLVGPRWSAGTVQIKTKRGDRSECSTDGKSIRLAERAGVTIVVHECGHALEIANPKLLRAAVGFRSARVKAGKARLASRLEQIADTDERARLRAAEAHKYVLTPLARLEPGRSYGPGEKAYGDDFIDPYTGKVYRLRGRNVATEVWSMGLQRMAEDPLKLFTEDPDFFRFVWRTLRGIKHQVQL